MDFHHEIFSKFFSSINLDEIHLNKIKTNTIDSSRQSMDRSIDQPNPIVVVVY